MKELLPFIIVGIASGSVYGLAGVGLVLTFRTSGVLNFAHGATAAAGGVPLLLAPRRARPGLAAGLLVTLVVFGVVGGLALERLTRSLNRASPVAVVVLTVGLLLATQGFLALRFGDAIRYFPAFLPTSGFHVAGVGVGWDQVIGAVVALAGAAGLYAFLRLSHTGRSMRAVVENPTLVQLTGQRPATTARIAWAIGTSFAALSGLLLAPTLGLDATLLTFLVVQSFGACAIGLFKSLPLTYVGGLVVGVAASLATKYITVRPWTGLPSAVPFLILIVVLVAVSNTKLPEAGGRIIVADRRPPRPAWRSVALLAVGGGALVALPFLVGTYLPLWTNALSLVVIFGSLALLLWTSGQLSLCHMSFAALGATTVGHLTGSGVPWLVGAGGGRSRGGAGGRARRHPRHPAVRHLPGPGHPGVRHPDAERGLPIGVHVRHRDVGVDPPARARLRRRPQRHLVLLRGPGRGRGRGGFAPRHPTGPARPAAAGDGREPGDAGHQRARREHHQGARVLRCRRSSPPSGAGCSSPSTGRSRGWPSAPSSRCCSWPCSASAAPPWCGPRSSPRLLVAVLPGYVHALDTNTQQLVFGLAAVVAGLALANRPALAAWFARSAAETEDRVQRGPIPERVRAARRRDRDGLGRQRRRPVFAGRGER